MSGGERGHGVAVTSDERARLARLLEQRRLRIEPLSYGQAALWHLYQLAPESSAYNMAFTARVAGPLDLGALRGAAEALVRRHATLRTTYRIAKDRPVQVVHRELPVDWAALDASRDTEAELRARVVADYRRGFDLERGPILRVRVYRAPAGGHVLAIAVHHIAIDFASMRTLVADLGALYHAECAGVAAELPPLRAEYADFARAQLAQLAGPDGERLLAFWRRELEGAPPRLDVSHRPSGGRSSAPAVQTFHGATHALVLEAELVHAVKARSAKQHATLYHTLCATLAVLLSRHAGEPDIVFGITTSGRDRMELEDVVGYFVHTPPLRVELRGDVTFADLLVQVRQKALAVLEHAEYPLLLMSQELGGRRDPGSTPIFQVSFNMLHGHVGGELSAWWGDIDSGARIELGGLVLEPFPVPLQDGILDLSVWACEVGDRIYLEFKYNTERFDREAIARMAQHYRTLLAAVAADASRAARALPMLELAEQAQLLEHWNATARAYDREIRIEELFDAQARRTPEAVAVAVAGEAWSYARLAGHSDRLALHLQALGAGPGTLVAIFMDRRPEMISAVLAVAKAGAAYVPLDPSLPRARVALLLATHGIRLVVADGPGVLALRELPAGSLAHVTSVEPEVAAVQAPPAWREWGAKDWPTPAGDRARAGTADDVAYVIFTSGSTGTPKGVVVRHRPVVNLIEWVNRTFQVGPADRVLCVSSLSFDLSVYDIFGVLAAGGTVRLASSAELRDPEGLVQLLADEPITLWNSAPAMLQQLVPLFPGLRKAEPRLRLALLSGDWIPLTLPDDLRGVCPGVQVIALGGATEAVVWSNFFVVGQLDPAWVSIPYGRPIQNARYYVLDDARQPCPVGVAGDLYIGGECLSSGYLHDPELTAARFLPDPFVSPPGGRMYRTGDRARFFPDGNLEFLGRLDDQVKIRGFRIELGEIEAALRAHPAVQDCAVVAVGERHARRIVAYLVTRVPLEDLESRRPGRERDALRAYLRERLPEYMVPAQLVACERLLVTANGKLDRRALPAPDASAGELEDEVVLPRSPAEHKLAAIWADVLGVERVSVHASFFDLGGHSLLATQLLGRIRGELGVALSLRALFAAPTVAALGAEIAAGDASEGEALPQARPDPARRFEPFPLTDVQQAYWIGRRDDFEIGNVSTQLYQEFELCDLDLPRLTAALRALITRHDALRTIVRPDGLQQVLADVPPYEIEVSDLAALAPGVAQDRLAALREERCYRARDPGRWPLFEVSAARLSPRTLRLIVSIDVLIADARSLGILGLEWIRLYEHPEVALPPLEISFRDYVMAEAGLRGLSIYQRSLDYWRRRAPVLPGGPELAIAKPPHAITRPRFVRRAARLDRDTWARIKQHAARAGVTAASALAAAFAETLGAWSRTAHFTMNLTLLHRLPLHPQAQALVGDFTSLTLLEVDATVPAPFAQRARACHDQLWSDLDHRYVSGVQVLRERAQARPGAGLSYMPVVFTCVLDAVPDDPAPLAFFERHATPGFGIAQTPQVWLDYQSIETSRGLLIHWDGLEELFAAGVLDDMFAAHLGLLRSLADPAGWQQEVESLVPAAQRARHDQINDTAMALRGGLLHLAFQDRARERPDAPAVISSARTLSYGELSRRATAVGRWLTAHGAGPDQLVAVVMEKGWEQIVAVLGCLAAGAAYVPVDASLPEPRIHRLLALGRVGLVLTHASVDGTLAWPPGLACLAVDRLEPTAEDAVPLPPVQRPDDLAYVIFTSGSTGEPKGVMIQHAAAANTVADINQRYRVGPRDRVLAVSALGFDLSVWDIFGVLGAGGAVVVPDARGLRDPWHWAELVRQHDVTIWNSVPALMELVVEHLSDAVPRQLPSLRLVMLSGDWIPVTLPDRIRARAASAEIVSLGGATEAAIWSVAYPIGAVDPAWRSIPYGTPLANQQLLVLDAALRPRPDWVTGDLYIAGAGLARGYWDDPITTAKSFLIDPRTGHRLYRTGDLARRLPVGELEFLGRLDHQVKIHGHRIELGEIESALLDHPAVQAAAVIVRAAPNGAQQLEAYVVARDGADAPEDELRAALRRQLPGYMVPALFVRLEALPLSANGKIDRAALRAPASSAPPERTSGALRTAHEVLVAEVWGQVLQVAASSRDDDFFVCGGDSIRAIQLVQNLRRRLPSLALTVADLYAAPTIGGFAAQLDRSSCDVRGEAPAVGGHAAEAFEEIERLPEGSRARLAAEFEDVYPANRVQQRILQEYAEAPAGSGVYHLQQMLDCRLADGEIATFREALTAVVARVRALRSVFLCGICDQPLVAVRRASALEIPEDDLRGVPREAQEARLAELFADDRARPFDVTDAAAALVRFRLVRRSDVELILFFSIHHALWDGWSNAEFYNQLHAAHGRLRAGRAAPAPSPVDASREFVAWERRRIEADGAVARHYWAARLAGAPASRPVRAQDRGGHPAWHPPVMLTLDAHDLGALDQLARDLRVTTKALLMRGFLDALSPGAAGEPGERLVGVVANRRSEALTDPWAAMGLFWNIVPFRYVLTAHARGDALAIHAQLLELEAHAWYPLGGLAGEPPRPEPYEALFNFINLHNFRPGDDGALQFHGLRAYDRYHLPLNSLFAIMPAGGGLTIRLEYDPRRLEAAEVVALGDRLLAGLRGLAGATGRARAPAQGARGTAGGFSMALRAERAGGASSRRGEEIEE
jgi:amino acid adenylation domain-containing protein